MTDTQPTLTSVAATISNLANTLNKSLQADNVSVPSFAADSPISYVGLTQETFMARQVLLDAIMDMWYLTQGPSESIFNYAHTVGHFN